MNVYTIHELAPDTGAETVHEIPAPSLPAAIALVYATEGPEATLGIHAAHYAEAEAAGIAYNEADGLLVDPAPRECDACGEFLEADEDCSCNRCAGCARSYGPRFGGACRCDR